MRRVGEGGQRPLGSFLCGGLYRKLPKAGWARAARWRAGPGARVALLVHHAQAHTPDDSAGALAILTWVIGGYAALVWLGSAWHLGRRWRGTARSHRYAALR